MVSRGLGALGLPTAPAPLPCPHHSPASHSSIIVRRCISNRHKHGLETPVTLVPSTKTAFLIATDLGRLVVAFFTNRTRLHRVGLSVCSRRSQPFIRRCTRATLLLAILNRRISYTRRSGDHCEEACRSISCHSFFCFAFRQNASATPRRRDAGKSGDRVPRRYFEGASDPYDGRAAHG